MTGPCVIWTGVIGTGGYGRRGNAYAHRLAYEAVNGPIPTGMTVDHLCFNPPCVNPDHLRLLTPSENSRNQRDAYKTHCKRGHEFTPENTYARSDRRGSRICRACNRAAVARYAERKALAAANVRPSAAA